MATANMNSSQEDLSNNVVDISLPNMDVRNITQLKDELTKRKPRTRYKKRELATKLKNDLVREEEEEREENSDEEVTNEPRHMLTFTDIEGSIKSFSGDSVENVRYWIKEFEELAEMCEWTDIQKIIYCKRLLKGTAKLFVQYKKCGKTWKRMKKALISEFSESINSHKVHRTLMERKKNHDETYREYLYTMCDIAVQGNVEESAVIQYIIDGIDDDVVNKIILYGATTIQELKKKLVLYEIMKGSARNRSTDLQESKNKKQLWNQSDPVTRENLLTAAKQLVDSGIDLVNAIKYPTRNRESKTKTMSTTTKTNVKKYKKMSNVRPSAALVAAKRDAMQKKLLEGQKSMNVSVHDIYQKARDSYDTVRKETGLVFDWSMTEHECLWDLNYPECPDRLRSILQRCKALGLMDRCKEIEPRYAKDEEVLLKHTEEHVKILAATEKCTDNEKLESISSGYDAIFIHPSTYKQSLLAVGCTVDLVQNICKAEVQNGMAIIRPPGHHAMKFEYCGYCFFNNVAIAAQKALNDNLASKILIVDWDVHHGQATQQMFYEDPRVVYFSIHRYEHGKFWPNLRESDYDYVGEGLGKGYNFNVPLNKIGMTNADYIAIFQQVLLPMAYEFQPDLVIVSAGYDAALGCPEGEMLVTPACYTHLLSSLLSLASGKVAVILEGGYCLKSLAESAALTLRTLLGDPCPMLESLESPSESIIQTILNTICAHKPYWKCYQYQDTYSCKSEKIVRNCHIPDVIYSYCNLRSKPSNGYETRNCYPIQSKEQLNAINKELNALIKSTNLSKAQHRLCIVYDDRMLKHYDVSDDTHPEKPNRITGIYNRLKEHGLIERSLLKEGKRATMDQLLSVHSKDYVDRIKSTESQKLKEILKQAAEFNSIYLQPETWASACISAGSLLQVVDSVLTGEAQSGVAIIRPPGHHADKEMACGFCIFNNVAVAAKHALENHHIERLLIVDWDVHHGNGTQAIFEHDPKVLYTSVHRYDNGNFFPNSKQANYTHVGIGLGRGFNVNIPWNNKGMGNAEYIAAFQQVIMPIAYQFNPQLILVSAGFDACVGDPLGGCFVTPEMYGHLTHWLSSLANGRIILCLEGGYNVNSISHAMAMCTKALLGDPLPVLDAGQVPCECAIETIKKVLRTQAEYWPNLAYNKALPAENIFEKSVTNDTQIKNRERNVCKHSESKIALEGIENEKLELKLMIDENCLNVVTVEEVSKLQNEVENMKTSISELTDMVKMIKDIEITDCPREVRREPQLIDEDCQATKTEDYNESACGSITTYQDNNLCFENINTMRYAIIPKRDCPHLHLVADVPPSGIGVNLPCVECNSRDENWICLQCYTVRCGRFIRQHALMHGEEKKHPLTLSLADISVWCYECEAYIQSPVGAYQYVQCDSKGVSKNDQLDVIVSQ